ncbi:MAG: hypothetical protein EBY17_24515, partial [Acidobacteriia bacterium]|nr:hypothetical protein [Terriglobia bacterium]
GTLHGHGPGIEGEGIVAGKRSGGSDNYTGGPPATAQAAVIIFSICETTKLTVHLKSFDEPCSL